MPEYSFTVPGTPCPWQVFQRGGQRRNRSTGLWETASGYLALHTWQAEIQRAAIEYWYQRGPRKPLTGLVYLRLEFYLPYPASAPQHNEDAKRRWRLKHRGMRPDRTNYLKGFEDALQGIVYVNDSQVVDGPILKEYADGPEGYTVVWIQELTEVTSQ